MMGVSHAASGLVAGLGAGIVLHRSLPADAALSGYTAGMALLPDLDTKSSCASRSLGFVSVVASWPLRKLCGGHRHASHGIAGIALFTLAAWLSCHFRHDLAGKIGLGFLLVISTAGALEALHLTRGHAGDVIGIGVAAAVIWHGYGLALIPLAVLVGTSTHILGDMVTVQGCPLADPLSQRHQFLLPRFLRFTTGHWQETRVVDPLLLLSLAVLASWAVAPGFDVMVWRHFAGVL